MDKINKQVKKYWLKEQMCKWEEQERVSKKDIELNDKKKNNRGKKIKKVLTSVASSSRKFLCGWCKIVY